MRCSFRFSLVLLAVLSLTPDLFSDFVRLRNTRKIEGEIESFDEDGVRFRNRSALVDWAEIDSGTLSKDQERFDKMLKELALPLYRINLRMKRGNYADVLTLTEKLFPRYANRRSKTAFLVCQGLMWARISKGEREKAVEPYLICLDIVQKPKLRKLEVPGPRSLRFDMNTGLCPELTPIWFDQEAAKSALPGVERAMKQLPDKIKAGGIVYLATLAMTAGEDPAQYLKQLSENSTVQELTKILAVQREVQTGKIGEATTELRKVSSKIQTVNQPLAYYWLGLAGLKSSEVRRKKQAILRLLSLAAVYEKTDSELAGASIYHSYRALSDLPDSSSYAVGIGKLRTELLVRHPQSHFARRLKKELDSGSREPSDK